MIPIHSLYVFSPFLILYTSFHQLTIAPDQNVSSKIVSGFFFFSSRRRHTRSKRDWSSDVCSSDLSTGDVTASSVAMSGVWARIDCAVGVERSWGSGDGDTGPGSAGRGRHGE